MNPRIFTCYTWEAEELKNQRIKESKNPRIRTYFSSRRPKNRRIQEFLHVFSVKLKNPRIQEFKHIFQQRSKNRRIQESDTQSIYSETPPCPCQESKNLRIQACFLERGSGESKNLRIQAHFLERDPENLKNLRIQADFRERGPGESKN